MFTLQMLFFSSPSNTQYRGEGHFEAYVQDDRYGSGREIHHVRGFLSARGVMSGHLYSLSAL